MGTKTRLYTVRDRAGRTRYVKCSLARATERVAALDRFQSAYGPHRFEQDGESGELVGWAMRDGVERTEIAGRQAAERVQATTGFAVGDGVRWAAGTDCEPGTVVRVTAKSVYVVKDGAKLLNPVGSGEPDALEFHPGGFCGHESGTQRYAFNPGIGAPIRFSLRALRNGQPVFKMSGTGSATVGSMRGWGVLLKGRSKHYDNNR